MKSSCVLDCDSKFVENNLSSTFFSSLFCIQDTTSGVQCPVWDILVQEKSLIN